MLRGQRVLQVLPSVEGLSKTMRIDIYTQNNSYRTESCSTYRCRQEQHREVCKEAQPSPTQDGAYSSVEVYGADNAERGGEVYTEQVQGGKDERSEIQGPPIGSR